MGSALVIDKLKLGNEFREVYPGDKLGIETPVLIW